MMRDKDNFLDKGFDFSKAVRNPYAKELKKQVTIKIAPSTIDYFKEESIRTGLSYQTLINEYFTQKVSLC